MNNKPSVLIMIGSAKQPHSNSEMLGEFISARLREKGCETETVFLAKCLESEETRERFLEKTVPADVIVLAAPLFVDSLPALVTETMERIANHRKTAGQLKATHFAAIINCGFPESSHNETALGICRLFAREARFNWLGGLSLGGGEILNAQPLNQNAGMLRPIVKALELAAHAIADKKPIPDEALRLMAKPVIPRWMYNAAGNRSWKKRAKNFNAQNHLTDQPFRKKTS